MVTKLADKLSETTPKTREILCHRLGAVMSRSACNARRKRAEEMIHNPHFRDCLECGGENTKREEGMSIPAKITCWCCEREAQSRKKSVEGRNVCGFCAKWLEDAMDHDVPIAEAKKEIMPVAQNMNPGHWPEKNSWSWRKENPEAKDACHNDGCKEYNNFRLSHCNVFSWDELSRCKLRNKKPKAATADVPPEKVSGECGGLRPETEAATNAFAKMEETQASPEIATDKSDDIPGINVVTLKVPVYQSGEAVLMRLDERRVKILQWVEARGVEQMRDVESQLWWMLERMMDADRETA